MKQNFYQLEGSKLKEFISILHLPYTLMCLSFLTIGFAIEGIKNWYLYGYTLLAYFIGLGISAHAFDQLEGMGSRYVKYLKNKELIIIGLCSIFLSLSLGMTIMLVYKLWGLLLLIPLQTFFVFSYPLGKSFGGKFHTDFWFAISFGYIPVIVGNYINTGGISPSAFVFGPLCFIISLIEITLSRHVRNLRNKLGGQYENDSAVFNRIVYPLYIQKPELALKLLCVLSYLLAITIVIYYFK